MKWKHVNKIQYVTSLIFIIFPIASLFETANVYLKIVKGIAIAIYVCSAVYMMQGRKKYLPLAFACIIVCITIFIHLCNVGNILFYLFPISFVPYAMGKSLNSLYSKVTLSTLLINYAIIYTYDYKIAIEISAHVLFMFMMAFSMDYFAKQSRMTYEMNIKNEKLALLSSQIERNRISQDLHDSLGQVFSTLTVKSELALKLLKKDPEGAKNEMIEIQKLSQSSLFKVRSIIDNIKSRTIEDEVQHISQLLNDANIELDVTVNYQHLDEVKHHEISMLLKELVNNIIKHSGATHVNLNVQQISDRLHLMIEDNGKGLKPHAQLVSISSRVKALNGEVQVTNLTPGLKIEIDLEVD
ncbi:sensor histidine kinase [Macrococcus sp. DPC7161]|nr:sensor histidine kinase [Macrococcus sp. DPC7161]